MDYQDKLQTNYYVCIREAPYCDPSYSKYRYSMTVNSVRKYLNDLPSLHKSLSDYLLLVDNHEAALSAWRSKQKDKFQEFLSDSMEYYEMDESLRDALSSDLELHFGCEGFDYMDLHIEALSNFLKSVSSCTTKEDKQQ